MVKFTGYSDISFEGHHQIVFKICTKFDFTCAILLNGDCEGHIKVRCKMFDECEIAIQVLYIDTKIKTLGAIFDKIYQH